MRQISFIFLAFTVLILACGFSFHAEGAGKDLVLYFPFDQVTGDIVEDQSDNGFEGVLVGGVEFSEVGKYDGALSFDGSTGLVKVEDDDKLDMEGSYTVMAWAYPTIVDGGFRWIADKSNTNTDLNFILGISSNNGWRFITRKNLPNDLLDAGVVATEKWYHIAGVQDGEKGEVFLYIDGKVAVKKALAGDETKNDGYLSIGCRKDAGNTCQFFGGIIDELAIFSKALTGAEINRSMKGLGDFLAVSQFSHLATNWGNIKAQ